jgi:hypothetical protein
MFLRLVSAVAVAATLFATGLVATPNAHAGVTPHCGDASGDGIVNSIDAAIVLQYIAGLTTPNVPDAQLDPDGNNVVDARDVALILQAAAHYYHVRDFRCHI